MVVIHCVCHVCQALHSAMLSFLRCDDQESQVSECQSGIFHYHCDHQSKARTGSKKESLMTDETFRTSVSLYVRPVQCSICYMCFLCVSSHVIQSIIISIILLDSRLKLSRVIPLSGVASVVNLSCHSHLQNGSNSTDLSSGQ